MLKSELFYKLMFELFLEWCVLVLVQEVAQVKVRQYALMKWKPRHLVLDLVRLADVVFCDNLTAQSGPGSSQAPVIIHCRSVSNTTAKHLCENKKYKRNKER